MDSYEEIESAVRRMAPALIPRVIHQIWLGPAQAPRYTMETCRLANPGWLHVVWTDENLPPMVNRKVFDAFGAAYHAKADVLRYEVLFRFGGVYVDADQLCLRSFDDLLGSDAAPRPSSLALELAGRSSAPAHSRDRRSPTRRPRFSS